MMTNEGEGRILRGKYVDMRLNYADSDEWSLCRPGDRKPLVIGTREQIMTEYDNIEKTGIIPKYGKDR